MRRLTQNLTASNHWTPSLIFPVLSAGSLQSLTAATEEGALYEVDMQLRPSGGAGPAAVNKTAFVKYFSSDAWTWEVMALTKARMIAGNDETTGDIC